MARGTRHQGRARRNQHHRGLNCAVEALLRQRPDLGHDGACPSSASCPHPLRIRPHFSKGPAPRAGLFHDMDSRLTSLALNVLAATLACAWLHGADLPPTAKREVDFAKDVRPIL